MKSKTMNTSVKSDPKTVYDFISNLENLPKWAPSTFPSIKEVIGEWLVDTPQGQNKVTLTEKNNFGILDHYVRLTSGVEVYVPMRVVKNNDGSEILLTVFQTPEMTNELFAEDIKMVEKDLIHLKTIIEKSQNSNGGSHVIMAEMSKGELNSFLRKGTFTAKLATVKKDGSPHVVPVWFVLDDEARTLI